MEALRTWPESLVQFLTPHGIRFGVPHLAKHSPLIVRSLTFWLALQYLSSKLSPVLFSKHYPQLKRATRRSWDIHFVALVHALIITPLCARVWFRVYKNGGLQGSDPLALDRTYAYDAEAGKVYAIALGYFVWDTIVSALFDGPAFVAHGVTAMLAFVFVYHPIFMYDGLGFLLWEASTPFLNIHWFLDKVGKTGTRLQLVNAFFLLSTYVLARLTFGVYNSYSWFMHVHFPATPHVPSIPIHLKVFYTVGNVTLNSLNFIWFRAMIRAVQKRFTSKPAKPDPRAVLSGKEKVEFGVSGTNDESFEAEAGVGVPGRERFERRDIGSYGGEVEREARWRKVAAKAQE